MIGKLRNRSRAELRDRLWQFAWNRLDQYGLVSPPIGDVADTSFPRTPWPAVDAAAIRARIPTDERDALLARADRILNDRFDVLGLEGVSYGAPVQWQLDPLSGKSAAKVPWTQVPYLDASVVGDHKLIWEVNRHQWFITLAQAWVLTGDDRYTAHAAALLRDWLRENPPKVGINWCSALELAFRVQSWVHGLHIAAGAPSIDGVLVADLRAAAAVHCQHIEHNLSTWFSPNTHLTGEALALLAVGTAWPSLPQARQWQRRGWSILMAELPKQIRPDGVYFEQSAWYQSYTVDFYLLALAWGAAAGISVTAEARARVQAGARALHAITRSDGTVPLIGDDDGGCTLPLRVSSFGQVSDTLWRAAVMLEDDTLRPGPQTCPTALLWLQGLAAHDRMTGPAPASAPVTQALRDGGWVVMREAAEGRSGEHLLLLDAGPHGTHPHGHSHADALGIDLTVAGVPVLVDPGTGAYVGEPRGYFRSTAVHNTVTVDGADSSEQGSSFKWQTVATTTLSAFGTANSAAWAVASHDGYARLPDPVRHQRVLVRVRGRYWLLCDLFDAAAAHRLSLTLQAAAGMAVTPCSGGFVVQGRGVGVQVGVEARWTAAVVSRRVSPAYARECVAPAITATTDIAGPDAFCTVLGSTDEVSALSVERQADGRSWVVETGDGRDLLALPRGVVTTLGPATFDGMVLLVAGPESALRVVAAGAGILRLDGVTTELGDQDIRVAHRAPDGSWLMEN